MRNVIILFENLLLVPKTLLLNKKYLYFEASFEPYLLDRLLKYLLYISWWLEMDVIFDD